MAVVLLLGATYAVLSLTLEFNGDTLGRSLAGETGAPFYQFGCTAPRERERWSCSLFDGQSAVARYSVLRTDGTCWSARRVPPSDNRRVFPPIAAGCIDVFETVEGALGFGPQLYD